MAVGFDGVGFAFVGEAGEGGGCDCEGGGGRGGRHVFFLFSLFVFLLLASCFLSFASLPVDFSTLFIFYLFLRFGRKREGDKQGRIGGGGGGGGEVDLFICLGV